MELLDFVEKAKAYTDMGWAVTEQAEKIFAAWSGSGLDEVLEECNLNAVRWIRDWLRDANMAFDFEDVEELLERLDTFLAEAC